METHYTDSLLKSLRSRGVDGPIAAMLSSDESCLVLFGSIHDGWILKAAQVLADISGFSVMIRPLQDSPISKWAQQAPVPEDPTSLVGNQSPEVSGPSEDLVLGMIEEDDTDGNDTNSVLSEGTTGSTTTENSDTSRLNLQAGVFRLRGGASEDVDPYMPWMSPVHNLDVRLDIHPVNRGPYKVDLLTKVQVSSSVHSLASVIHDMSGPSSKPNQSLKTNMVKDTVHRLFHGQTSLLSPEEGTL